MFPLICSHHMADREVENKMFIYNIPERIKK
jgi:hypothetical protein